MEASAIQAPSGLVRSRAVLLGPSLLRLRSDEQLVTLFRAGHEEPFRVIHDRYRQRLFAYTRQMLRGSRQDAEDALQDVFVRAYAGLRADDRRLALRAWLYRVAYNRCIDELRRSAPPARELSEFVGVPSDDPLAKTEQRENLRRLIQDVGRLPEQQRSALLMREFSGMPYSELAAALGVSTPAVKSLLVRARIGLAQSMLARDTACSEIREELTLAHDRGVRPNGMARRHLRDCASCRQFRGEVRGTSRQLAALVPALGPAGLLANLLGVGGGTGTGAAAGGGAAVTGVVGGGGLVAAGGLIATGAGHIATLLAAAAVTAGGAIEIQHTIGSPMLKHHAHHAVSTDDPAEPTGVLAVAAANSVAPAVVNHGSTLGTPASASSGRVGSSLQTGLPGRVHPRSTTTPSGATNASAAGPDPNGRSSFDAETGVSPVDLSGTSAPPSASAPGATTGTGLANSTSTAGSSSSSTSGASSSATGTSSQIGIATGSGSSTSGGASSQGGIVAAGTASAGSTVQGATNPAGSAHTTAAQQSTTTSRS